MNNRNLRDAYNKGFKSECYDNPYDVGTAEFNECERGWAQRIKRGFRCKPKNIKAKQKTFQEIYQDSTWRK